MQVSLILPVVNEAKFIDCAINSILNQKFKNKISFEILIADGGSIDGTLPIIHNIISNNSNICLIDNPKNIVSTGFNLALNNAKGKIIIRIDGHCEIPINYIEKCCNLLNSSKADIVGGVIETISTGLIGEAISIAQSSLFGVGSVNFRRMDLDQGSYVDTLAFGAHRREIFECIGGFDEEMICNQDDEFNHRAMQAGKKIWIDPTIKTKYFARSSYLKLFKQYFNYGFYKVRGIQKRGQIISTRHLIPATFIISLIGTLILGYFQHLPWLSYSVLSIYLIINIISSIIVSQKASLIPLLFLAFCTLHLGYGSGFIWGLVRFICKWRDKSLKDDHFNRKQFIANSSVVNL